MPVSVELMEIGQDLLASFTWDSLNKPKGVGINFDRKKLTEIAVVSGVQIYFVRNLIFVHIASMVGGSINPMLTKFLVEVLGKTAITILYRVLMKQQYTITDVLKQKAVEQLISQLFQVVMTQIQAPQNRNSS